MERSGCRRSLLRGEGLPDAQPREGEFHGGHRGAEPVGGGAFELGCRGVGGLGCGSARGVLAGRGFGSGCGGHWVRGISLKVVGWKARPQRHRAARAGKTPWPVTISGAYDGRSAIEATGEPSASERGSGGSEMLDRRWLAGFYRAEGWGREGTPYTYRRKKKRQNYRRDRTGSALAPMEVGMSADLGRHGC